MRATTDVGLAFGVLGRQRLKPHRPRHALEEVLPPVRLNIHDGSPFTASARSGHTTLVLILRWIRVAIYARTAMVRGGSGDTVSQGGEEAENAELQIAGIAEGQRRAEAPCLPTTRPTRCGLQRRPENERPRSEVDRSFVFRFHRPLRRPRGSSRRIKAAKFSARLCSSAASAICGSAFSASSVCGPSLHRMA